MGGHAFQISSTQAMKVRLATSTGCPVPQFVVEAETDEDKMFLRSFVLLQDYAKDEWKFQIHGYTFASGGVHSFNFGWARA